MYGTHTLAFQRIFVRMKIISLIFIRFSYVSLIRNSVTGPLVTQLESITTHDSTRLDPTAPFAYVLYRIYITDANVVNGLGNVLMRTFVFFNKFKINE
jgi:hypothetical protein